MKIKNLCFSYGEKEVLSNLNCEINGSVCVTGPSGCGKTTFLLCIASLLKPSGGEIIDAPKCPSFMFQEDRLFPWYTALQNVSLVTDDREKARSLLAAVELEGEEDSMPESLSGGMRRRVSLARTLAYSADMLILDEPFKGMDPLLTERMISLLKKAAVPVIITTHSEREQKLLGFDIISLAKKT